MLNHVDEAKRLEALALVREGRLYDLGRVLDENVPVFPGRYFRQTLVTTAHHGTRGGGRGERRQLDHREVVRRPMQLGTHLDALSHLQIGDRGYNGWTRRRARRRRRREAARRRDRAADRHARLARRRRRGCGPGDVIGLDDVGGHRPDARATRCSSTPAGARTGTTPSATCPGEPGPGLRASPTGSPSAASRSPAATRGATARCPPRTPTRPFEVPQILNVHHGVFIVENLDTVGARRRRRARVRAVLTHPKLRGATGAWTSPIALV